MKYTYPNGSTSVVATAYRFGHGRVNLKTVTTAADGTITTTYEPPVKNYDGGDEDEDVDDALLAEEEEDSFSAWDEVFDDWSELTDNQYEESYTGDPSALESDGEINYYESEVDWDSVSDWGWDSSWDDASNWE